MIQRVELYYDACQATDDMKKYIKSGWRVHTCTMSHKDNSSFCFVIVVYER